MNRRFAPARSVDARARRGRHRRHIVVALLVAVVFAACGSDASEPSAEGEIVTAQQCIVSLHGKGGFGSPGVVIDGIARLAPTGNGDGWGGREWRYDTADDYGAAVDVVTESIETAGCVDAAVHGFSNGAAFAAKLYCSGDTLDGRIVGIVIDDPVADAGTTNCEPNPMVSVALYWTGALDEQAPVGTECSSIDWTCSGGTIVGIERFARAAAISPMASPFSEHRRYDDAPEPTAWLVQASANR